MNMYDLTRIIDLSQNKLAIILLSLLSSQILHTGIIGYVLEMIPLI